MSEKEIVEVYLWDQEPEYYDRIMLLVGGKFVEIVKIVETMEDGLNGEIARVAPSPVSSGFLKKEKRRRVSCFL